MKQIALIFLSTMIILFIGLVFGYSQLNTTFELSPDTVELSVPLSDDFDKDFIRKRSF